MYLCPCPCLSVCERAKATTYQQGGKKELTVSEAQEEEEGPHDPKASADMAKPVPEAQVVILANVTECVCV